jgi:hypothetical protein
MRTTKKIKNAYPCQKKGVIYLTRWAPNFDNIYIKTKNIYYNKIEGSEGKTSKFLANKISHK